MDFQLIFKIVKKLNSLMHAGGCQALDIIFLSNDNLYYLLFDQQLIRYKKDDKNIREA